MASRTPRARVTGRTSPTVIITFPVFAAAPFTVVGEGLLLALDLGQALGDISASGGLSWSTALGIAVQIGGTYLGYRGSRAADAPSPRLADVFERASPVAQRPWRRPRMRAPFA